MAANSDGGNKYGLPDGLILDAPAPPAPSAASNYGLPEGFVLDKPRAQPSAKLPVGFEYADEPPAPKAPLPSKTFPLPEGYVFADEQPFVSGVPTPSRTGGIPEGYSIVDPKDVPRLVSGVPAPPRRPADLNSLYDPVAGYQGQQPLARPSEAEMLMLRSQARDAAFEDMRRQQARYAMSPNAVAMKFNGKARYIVFEDARLAESVTFAFSARSARVQFRIATFRLMLKRPSACCSSRFWCEGGEEMSTQPGSLENHRMVLTEIQYALDAVNAAVKGADFADRSQQRGISLLLGDLYCRLAEAIDNIGGTVLPHDLKDVAEAGQ